MGFIKWLTKWAVQYDSYTMRFIIRLLYSEAYVIWLLYSGAYTLIITENFYRALVRKIECCIKNTGKQCKIKLKVLISGHSKQVTYTSASPRPGPHNRGDNYIFRDEILYDSPKVSWKDKRSINNIAEEPVADEKLTSQLSLNKGYSVLF